jgi:predicted nucleic acid-binding Zn ribbon protein
MCPSCGESYANYPAGGTCPKCASLIPAPPGRAAKGIDEEIARLDGAPKVCPTCGKPLPAGRKTCPECSRVEPARERRHVSGWVSLLIVVLFIGISVPATVIMTKRWAHNEHQQWVQDDLKNARAAAQAGNFSDALLLLDQAQKKLSWFEDGDLTSQDLSTQIAGERNSLRQVVGQKVREMLRKGEEVEADAFYRNEGIGSLDNDSSLSKLIARALETRKTVLGYRATLKQSQKCYQEGQFTEALRDLTVLRNQVDDPFRAKSDIPPDLRTTVDALHTAWVQEALDKGMKLLDEGKLGQASAWLETTKGFLPSGDTVTRRRIDDTLSAIADGRVLGVVMTLGGVRVVKTEEARAQLLDQLTHKLSDEGLLPLTLSSRNDPKVGEVARVLLVDYREEKSGGFTSSETREKANGTRITCALKLVTTKDNKTLWQAPGAVTAQTGTVGGLHAGEFNDANLRLDAIRRFYIELDTVRIPSRDYAP